MHKNLKRLAVLLLALLLVLSPVVHALPASAASGDDEMPREWFGRRKVVDRLGRYTRVAIVHYVTEIGDPDNDGAADGYELLGVKWSPSKYPNGVPYIINPSGGVKQGLKEESVVSAIKSALEAWDAVVGVELYNDNPRVDYKAKASVRLPDFKNVITWGSAQPGVVAYAVIWYDSSTGEIVDADMVFNSYYKWGIADGNEATGDLGSRFDIQNVATHEAGHWTGLDDLYDSRYWAMTMYGYTKYGEEVKRSLEPGDVAGAQAIYG